MLFDKLIWAVLGYGVKNLEIEGEGKGEGFKGFKEVLKIGIRGGKEDTGVFGEREALEGEVSRESREKSLEI